MTLYEIDQAVLDCVDVETGEVLDPERLQALQMERSAKIENIGCWIKNMAAENSEIDKEILRLREMKERNEKKVDDLKKYLTDALGGEKYKSVRVSISYRKSQRVDVPDVMAIPEKYRRYRDPEPDKLALKDALQSGETIPGAALVDGVSLVVR